MIDPFLVKEEAEKAIVEKATIGEESWPLAFTIVQEDDPNPYMLGQAQQPPDWPEWKSAIRAEPDQLRYMGTGTWELVVEPTGGGAVLITWALTK
jgi:hypothetical protein